ncbi:hypothetical protein [Streptomyces sp. CMB-StM0423]|uniref:hypothetical protein n=1 Tax=Streptomyces sp. CMB-StM0423 TaxID=2059884 RepID=UPI001F3ED4E7|nr:hypothetical protein [Streptomyces sp. CMB-StM0423]
MCGDGNREGTYVEWWWVAAAVLLGGAGVVAAGFRQADDSPRRLSGRSQRAARGVSVVLIGVAVFFGLLVAVGKFLLTTGNGGL